jgi:hypothetical protein
MRHGAGAHHVEVDVCHATKQVRITLHRGGVVAVLPKCTEALLALIVGLRRTTGHKLHRRGNLALAPIPHQQMHVVAGDDVVQDAESVAPPRLEQPRQPAATIPPGLQQEIAAMAALGDVPDLAGQEYAVGTWHVLLLRARFLGVKIAR